MPKRSIRKKLAKIRKGLLVKWIQKDEKLQPWDDKKYKPLKTGDLGIVLGRDDSASTPANKTKIIVYWQRTKQRRTMLYKDFQIVQRL